MIKSIKTLNGENAYYNPEYCIFFNNVSTNKYYIYSFYLEEESAEPSIIEISAEVYNQEKTDGSTELLVTSVDEIFAHIIELKIAAYDAIRPLGDALKINDIKIPEYLLKDDKI